jgi:hypothetical protein
MNFISKTKILPYETIKIKKKNEFKTINTIKLYKTAATEVM